MLRNLSESLLAVFICSLHWFLLAACYELPLDQPAWPSQLVNNDDLLQGPKEEEQTNGIPAAPEPVIARILSSIRGDPQLLTLQELHNLRTNTPDIVSRFVTVINSEALAEDVRRGRVSADQLHDLHNSLVFLDSEKCHMLKAKGPGNCLVINKPLEYPKEGLFSARLSAFVYPWVNLNHVYLTVYHRNASDRRLPGKIFHLRNVTALSENRINEGDFEEADLDVDAGLGYHISWDITNILHYLQRNQRVSSSSPIVMLLTYRDDNRAAWLPWQLLPKADAQRSQVVKLDNQVILEIHSKTTENIFQKYSDQNPESNADRLEESQEIRSKRSTEGHTECPSFLDKNRHQTKCCLFRFILNKQQIESNDKLRFIVFPDHLPMNVCHGRCIGVESPKMKMHNFLMNQYFAGLSDEDRRLIYEAMPCCSASKARNFTIVYKEPNGKMVNEELADAIKEECSCN